MAGTPTNRSPFLPPRWFIRGAWVVHRALYSITGGRLGLGKPTAKSYGTLRLHTTGRKTGAERVAMLGYFEDGPNLFTLAMNGWGEPEPAWWLNLQANPDATLDLPDGPRQVRARVATGDERARLWSRDRAAERGPRRLRRPPITRDGRRGVRASTARQRRERGGLAGVPRRGRHRRLGRPPWRGDGGLSRRLDGRRRPPGRRRSPRCRRSPTWARCSRSPALG